MPPVLCLYNEGNFFNEVELPAEARTGMLRMIGADRRIKRLVLESLPEHISEKVLQETKELLGHVELELGIGLESADPKVRMLCINKSYSLAGFESVAARVRKHCRLLAYVLVKPSFLTEKEALDDSIRAARFAFDAGADVVSIEPISLGKYTMASILNQLGMYRTAWLWTVLEVAKAAQALGEVRIGGYQFAPSYEQHARNCDLCTPRVWASICEFNKTYRPEWLNVETCACTDEWRRELAKEYPPLEDRIADALDAIRRHLNERVAFPVVR